jgi:hypothetical protein
MAKRPPPPSSDAPPRAARKPGRPTSAKPRAPKPTPEAAPEPLRIAAQVNTLKATGGALAGEVARIEWTLTDDPGTFAAAVRARVDAVEVAPVTADTQAELAAFLAAARERGRAPPPVDRR